MTVSIETCEYAIRKTVEDIERRIRNEVRFRAFNVSESMKDTSVQILSGKRHGNQRTYHGRHYTASAPGEPPAQRSGALSHSFRPDTTISENDQGMMIHSKISSEISYAPKLEQGWGYIKPRPYGNRIYDRSVVRAINEFRRPYR